MNEKWYVFFADVLTNQIIIFSNQCLFGFIVGIIFYPNF